MRRRPEQQSMLSLMGAKHLDDLKPPFAGAKLSGMKVDSDGNITEVTIVGTECPSYPDALDEDPWWDQSVPQAEEE